MNNSLPISKVQPSDHQNMKGSVDSLKFKNCNINSSTTTNITTTTTVVTTNTKANDKMMIAGQQHEGEWSLCVSPVELRLFLR